MPCLLLIVSLPRNVSGKRIVKGFADLMSITGNIKRLDEKLCELLIEHLQKEKLSLFLGTVFAHFQDKGISFLVDSIKYLGRKMFTSFKIIENKGWVKTITDISSDDSAPLPKIDKQRNNETFCMWIEEELEVLQVPQSDLSDIENQQTSVVNVFRFNLIEEANKYIYEIVTPGFNKSELEITKTKRNLYVTGEKKQTRSGKVKMGKFPIHGVFRTKLPLPPSHGKVLDAFQEDGLLVVVVEKETFVTEKVTIRK